MFYKKLILFHISRFFCLFKKQKAIPNLLDSEDGIATIETVPLLTIFIFLITYAIGYWGAIHSATLSAIGARTYALETFRNRSHLAMFRESINDINYTASGWGMRLHRISEVYQQGAGIGSVATKLPISFNNYNMKLDDIDRSSSYHMQLTEGGVGRTPANLGYGSSERGDSNIWLQIGYGYCLTLSCGDN